jgi:mRNA interferase MazF
MTEIRRGELWEVRFDPAEGDEIKKIRPAVVLTAKSAGRMSLEIVVPVTGWQPQFASYFWMVQLLPDAAYGLSKESAADAFQVKSLSSNRFQSRLGSLPDLLVNRIVAAIVLCVGYVSPVK